MAKFGSYNQGQALIGILIVLVTVVVIIGGLYYSFQTQIPEPQKCLNDNECEENETCDNNKCQIIICEYCEYIENRQCKNYECCSDTACDDNNPKTIDKCLNPRTENSKCEYEITKRCDDGTIYGECSSLKPLYCENGNLIDRCSVCDCPSDQQCQTNESCITPTLSVALSAIPSSGDTPLDVKLTAEVSGITTGPANYIFYCNRSDPGIDVIPGYNNRIDYAFSNSYTDVCNYPSPGAYTAKVIVERGGLATENRVTISISSAVQCTSGPCCDLTTQTFSLSTYKCQENIAIEYSCPWGSNPGDDVGIRYQDRYCSGNSASCDGELQWGDWVVDDDCALNETCVDGTCTVSTLTCSDGIPYGQCSANQPKYCDDGNLINNCSLCGCPSDQQCQADESCIVPTLSVSLSADPSSGYAPLDNVNLTAQVSESATGPINYTFYCNRSDSGTDITPDYDHKKDGATTNSYAAIDVCNYSAVDTYTAKVIIERGALTAENRTTIVVEDPSALPDLDVTFIERDPKYPRYKVSYSPPGYNPYLSGGQTESNQRWPNPGQTVTFTSHVRNKGNESSGTFDYEWKIDGIVVESGTMSNIEPGNEATESFQWQWQNGDHLIEFIVDVSNSITETIESNNKLSDYSNALTYRIHIEQSVYDEFNNVVNLVGSKSFEDWIQAHINEMETEFSAAGINEKLRIDEIVIETDGSLPRVGTHAPENIDWDGTWGFETDEWPDSSVHTFAPLFQGALFHELGHQIGIIDSYQLNYDWNYVPNNEVIPGCTLCDTSSSQCSGQVSQYENCTYYNNNLKGIMMGQYYDGYSTFTAGSLNSHVGSRRGYFGEYLYDIPTQNKIRVLDTSANPIVGAQIYFYQDDGCTRIENAVVFSGTTDSNGYYSLPNRAAASVTTETGHTLSDNPFGDINIVGCNGIFVIKIVTNSQTDYQWMDISMFNIAYWSGNTTTATYEITTTIP